MAAEEQLVLDGLTLHDATFILSELDMTPPRPRQEWIGAADSEWQVLMRAPKHENREIMATLLVLQQSTTNLAMDKIGLIVDKFRLASQTPDGIDLVWTPADGTRSVTFDCLAGEVVGLPINDAEGWLIKAPTIRLKMVCKPYWTGTLHTTVTDAFGSNSIADYTFDAGAAGNVSITGGVMDAAANLTTENRFYHSASAYNVTSAQVHLKHTLGTTLTSYKAGVILKRIDASNYLEAYVDDNGTNSRIRIDKVLAGARTNLATSNLTRMTISTAYWIRARLEGNVAFAEHFTSAPSATTSASATITTTLAGGDATALGRTVQGRAGIVWIPQQTAATLDDLEIAPNVATANAPFVTTEVANTGGDIPALGVLTVTDAAGNHRRHVEFGVEGQYYNSATSLLIDSDSMVVSGFSGTQTTSTGAYDPNASGNSAITCNLITTAVNVAGTGDLTHAGTYVVKGRFKAATTDVEVRLTWQSADGPWKNNAWVSLQVGGDSWEERDLGALTIPQVTSGTQRWTGKIQARTTTGTDTIILDYLELVPTSDGYGKARSAASAQAGTLVAYDQFTSTTAAAGLNGTTADGGGTWATSGAATDITFSDSPGLYPAFDECVTRNASGVRYAIHGSTAYTDMQVVIKNANLGVSTVIARWVDSNNYFYGEITGSSILRTGTVIGGVNSPGGGMVVSASVGKLDLTARADGTFVLVGYGHDGVELGRVTGWSVHLATSGALDDGKPGFADTGNVDFAGQYWDDFLVFTPAPEPIVIYNGRTMQFRHDDTIRQDSAGTYTGKVPSYKGSRFLVPVGTSRVLVKTRPDDVDVAADTSATLTTRVQVDVTPRGLVVPR